MIIFLIVFVFLQCERKKIYNVIEINDSFLPNIHWKILSGDNYVEVDTLSVKSGKLLDVRLEIYYNDPKDFRVIEIAYQPEISTGAGGLSIEYMYLTDMKLESVSDKITIDQKITIPDFKIIKLNAIISEQNKIDYDLRRYKPLYISNPDSI
jgi:hypothetical protein